MFSCLLSRSWIKITRICFQSIILTHAIRLLLINLSLLNVHLHTLNKRSCLLSLFSASQASFPKCTIIVCKLFPSSFAVFPIVLNVVLLIHISTTSLNSPVLYDGRHLFSKNTVQAIRSIIGICNSPSYGSLFECIPACSAWDKKSLQDFFDSRYCSAHLMIFSWLKPVMLTSSSIPDLSRLRKSPGREERIMRQLSLPSAEFCRCLHCNQLCTHHSHQILIECYC